MKNKEMNDGQIFERKDKDCKLMPCSVGYVSK